MTDGLELAAHGSDAEWFEETGHCGHCGDPGDYCRCTNRDPCGCRALHVMGSAFIVGALNAFADGCTVEVSAEQQELFG